MRWKGRGETSVPGAAIAGRNRRRSGVFKSTPTGSSRVRPGPGDHHQACDLRPTQSRAQSSVRPPARSKPAEHCGKRVRSASVTIVRGSMPAVAKSIAIEAVRGTPAWVVRLAICLATDALDGFRVARLDCPGAHGRSCSLCRWLPMPGGQFDACWWPDVHWDFPRSASCCLSI